MTTTLTRAPLIRPESTTAPGAASLSNAQLRRESRAFEGTGGRSEENRGLGFLPAFFDTETCRVYMSCFADGRPAPFHLIDGLPGEVVVARHLSGRVAGIKRSVVSGFLLQGRFYTREEAAAALA
jgi:hypothetical protein